MNTRTLSTGSTFVAKYVAPPTSVIAFAWAAVTIGLVPAQLGGSATASAVPFWMRGLFSVACVVTLAAMVRWAVHLKRVRVEDDALFVSNYLREWRVPFSAIASVTQKRWTKGRPITVQLRADVGFGRQFVFIPRVQFSPWTGRESPEVEELRRAAGVGAAR